MARFNLNDRPVPSGSMELRLNPKFRDDNTLNHNLGPKLPRPLVRETSESPVRVGSNATRHRMVGLPERFNKD